MLKKWPIPISQVTGSRTTSVMVTRPSTGSAVRQCGFDSSSHGSSHRKVISPKVRNTWRQPEAARISPPAKVPMAGPKASDELTTLLAMPRRSGATWRAMMAEAEGKATPSPMPSRTRKPTSIASEEMKPIAVVASAQMNSPTATSR